MPGGVEDEILEAEGHQVHLIACDVSQRRDVHEVAVLAASLGTIKTVIHAAGLSPTMADPEQIIVRVPLIPEYNNAQAQASSAGELRDMGVKRLDLFEYVKRD